MLEVLPFEEDLDLSGNLCYPGCVCCTVFTFCLLQSETFVGLIKVNETMASFWFDSSCNWWRASRSLSVAKS